MKAIVQERYGSLDVLQAREVDPPTVGDDEVLLRAHAASVHPDVWHLVRGRPFVLRLMGAGLARPGNRIPGTDVAGRVEAIGRRVTRFQPGDEVFGETIRGHQWRNGGALAEYVTAPEAALATKPTGLSFEQAAAVPTSGLIALQAVRDQGRVRSGQSVLVNGAGGGVGTFAVQLAKAYGAEVTGVDASSKLETIRSIGADRVIDCAREDFTRSGTRYDLIVDVPGNRPFSDCRRALKPGGIYVLIGHDGFGRSAGRWFGSLPRFLKLIALSPFLNQLPGLELSRPDKAASLAAISELIETERLMPVVDRHTASTRSPTPFATSNRDARWGRSSSPSEGERGRHDPDPSVRAAPARRHPFT